MTTPDIPPEVKAYINAALRRSSVKEKRMARAVVRETLLAIGIDASTPSAVQEAQKDFSMLRRFRLMSEARGPKLAIIVFSTIMTFVGAVGAILVDNMLGGP